MNKKKNMYSGNSKYYFNELIIILLNFFLCNEFYLKVCHVKNIGCNLVTTYVNTISMISSSDVSLARSPPCRLQLMYAW